MTLICLLCLAAGMAAGLSGWLAVFSGLDFMASLSLLALTFGVGLQLGGEGKLLGRMKGFGARAMLLPLAVAVGSVLAGTLAGAVMGLPANQSASASAGLAWYSLSAAILDDIAGPGVAALALLTNLFRELIAFLITPLIAKKIGHLEAIAPAGSTAMDTALPIIAAATDDQTAVYSVICGFTLSLFMPLLVTILYRIF